MMNNYFFVLNLVCLIIIYQSVESQAKVIASISPAVVTAMPGEEISITIEVDMSMSGKALGSTTALLQWNPKFLIYQANNTTRKNFMGSVNDSEVKTGQLSFSGISPDGLKGKVKVLEIIFIVGEMGTRLELSFSTMAAALTFENLLPEVELGHGTINISKSKSRNINENLMLLTPLFLPGKDRVQTRFQIPESDFVSVQIFDAFGKPIADIVDEKLLDGYHEFEWDGDLHKDGIYAIRLQYQGETLIQKFLLDEF